MSNFFPLVRLVSQCVRGLFTPPNFCVKNAVKAAALCAAEQLEQRTLLSTVIISGTLFNDPYQTGRLWGQEGIGGQTIYADLGNSGSVQSSDPSTTTALNGAYSLTLHDVTRPHFNQC